MGKEFKRKTGDTLYGISKILWCRWRLKKNDLEGDSIKKKGLKIQKRDKENG